MIHYKMVNCQVHVWTDGGQPVIMSLDVFEVFRKAGPAIDIQFLSHENCGVECEPKFKWKQRTLYLVDVSWNGNNPIHPAILYSGFLDSKGEPTDAQIFCPGYEGVKGRGTLYYLKVVRVLVTEEELRGNRGITLPSNIEKAI